MMESIEKLRDCTWIGGGKVNEYLDEIEREIAERYMLLPVDADGVPIRVGDVMCSAGIREKGHKVIVSAIFEDGFVEYGNDNGLIGPLCQEDWVHAKPRTLGNEREKQLELLVNQLWYLVNHRSGYGYAAALEAIEELGIEVDE